MLSLDGLLLGDGGIATALQAHGMPLDVLACEWGLSHPEAVRAVHAEYAAAGAGWSTANSFGAEGLGPPPLARRAAQSAVAAARQGAPGLPVLASLGPRPFEAGTQSVYQAAVEAIAAASPDAFLVETITDLRAGEAAVRAAAEVRLGPVLASFTPGADGNLLDGTALEEAARRLARAGADAVGVNCGGGPESLFEPVARLVACGEGPVLAAPNAGLPVLRDGRAVYSLGPDSFARAAIKLRELGARLIAGCCGVGPEHIRAAHRALGLSEG